VSGEGRGQLSDAVAIWLEACRHVALDDVRKAGVPTELSVWKQVATEVTDTSASIEPQLQIVNPLTVGNVLAQLGRARAAWPVSPAAALHGAYGARCWYWTPMMQIDFEKDPVSWIGPRLLAPTADRFVSAVPRLYEPAPALASKLAEELLAFIEHDVVSLHSRMAMAGLRVEAPIGNGSVLVRPLTGEELGARVGGGGMFEDDAGMSLMELQMTRGAERSMVEVVDYAPKNAHRSDATWRLANVVTACLLLGFEIWGGSGPTRREEPFGAGTMFLPLPVAQRGGWRAFRQEDLDEVVRLAPLIPDEAFGEPKSAPGIALRRFLLGCADRTDADALIDFTIALEAVLLPRTKESELRFRFALNGAFASGAGALERPDTFKLLLEIYDDRSSVVHGGRVDPARLAVTARRARETTARILRQGLEHGWLDQDDFRMLALT
jgi:hypothetical protein